jgi:hypothetical protein
VLSFHKLSHGLGVAQGVFVSIGDPLCFHEKLRFIFLFRCSISHILGRIC